MWAKFDASVVVQFDFWFDDPLWMNLQTVGLRIHRMNYRRDHEGLWNCFSEVDQLYLREATSSIFDLIFEVIEGRIGKPIVYVAGMKSSWEDAEAILNTRRLKARLPRGGGGGLSNTNKVVG